MSRDPNAPPVKVADPEQQCPWCDGLGLYNYEWSTRGFLYRPCGQRGGTGQKK